MSKVYADDPKGKIRRIRLGHLDGSVEEVPAIRLDPTIYRLEGTLVMPDEIRRRFVRFGDVIEVEPDKEGVLHMRRVVQRPRLQQLPVDTQEHSPQRGVVNHIP